MDKSDIPPHLQKGSEQRAQEKGEEPKKWGPWASLTCTPHFSLCPRPSGLVACGLGLPISISQTDRDQQTEWQHLKKEIKARLRMRGVGQPSYHLPPSCAFLNRVKNLKGPSPEGDKRWPPNTGLGPSLVPPKTHWPLFPRTSLDPKPSLCPRKATLPALHARVHICLERGGGGEQEQHRALETVPRDLYTLALSTPETAPEGGPESLHRKRPGNKVREEIGRGLIFHQSFFCRIFLTCIYCLFKK